MPLPRETGKSSDIRGRSRSRGRRVRETGKSRDIRGRSRSRRWSAVATLAGGQHGLVARAQLLAKGLAASAVDDWVAAGRLHAVYPGVYLVGHAVAPPYAREHAAVLACGTGAVASHRTAAELWELIERLAGFGLQVTVPGRKVQGPGLITVHHTQNLPPDEISEVDGIPVTSPARTVLDLASQAPPGVVARAYEEGLIRELFDRDAMIALVARHNGRRGIKKIRHLIDRDAPPSITYKEAHWRLLRLIRRSGLPHPETEVRIPPYRVDILWRAEKVIVEMDGAAFHSTENRQEEDKLRDGELSARGYVVLRVTWRQLTREPEAVIARIARTITARAAGD